MDREEIVYNLFVYEREDGLLTQIGIRAHVLSGTDRDKVSKLQAMVEADYQSAKTLHLPRARRMAEYHALHRLGRTLELFEPLLQMANAPADPLVVTTIIGKEGPKIERVESLDPLGPDDDPFFLTSGTMQDYLLTYSRPGGLDLPQLFEDDYFAAIKLLYNGKKYIAALKLIVSLIDTVAFVEFDDTPKNFQRWLNTYADLDIVGVSAEELWEFRNGLLHMSSLSSRKAKQGKVNRLVPLIAGDHRGMPAADGFRPLPITELIRSIAAAMSRWFSSYNSDPDKFLLFISRYDGVVSEARLVINE